MQRSRVFRGALLLVVAGVAFAQEYAASFSIRAADPDGRYVPDAQVVLTEEESHAIWSGKTDTSGLIAFSPLPPGRYSLDATKQGFTSVHLTGLDLGVRGQKNLTLHLSVAVQTSSVTVSDSAASIATDPSMGISVDQDYFENLPINGRSVDALVKLAPGITSGSGPGGGDINANGLRSNTNYYTLDGVSLNGSVGGVAGPGAGGPGFGGGPPPGAEGGGGATSALSLDSLQEVRIQTSSFAPEFGRSPGAQISMTSRGGGNVFHGSAFYYFRDKSLEANDWFANSRGYGRADMHQNRAGGTLGGPVVKKRTFFFVSYEGLRLLSPATIISSVPDLASRRSAPASERRYLNAFPLPNGAEQTNGAAEYHATLSNPSTSDSISLRVDHTIGNGLTLFARYGYAINNSSNRGGFSATNVVSTQSGDSQSGTIGLTKTGVGGWVNDARFNYSRTAHLQYSTMDNYGGAVALTDAAVFPSGVNSTNGQFSLSVLGAGGYSFGGSNRNAQQQLNGVDSWTKAISNHTLKVGIDYRRTMPVYYRVPYTLSVTFNGTAGSTSSLLSGTATNVQVTSNLAAVYPVYSNFSAYAQDTWRATTWTTITYGLRWDVNPAPGVRQGPTPLALSSDSIAGVTQNDPLYPTRWFNVAPRIGLAYQMDDDPGKEMVFRMGYGFFYDIGYGVSASAFNGAPYSNVRTISAALFPLSAADLSAPAMPPQRPYGQVTAADTNLASPLVKQWNATIDRNFGRNQTLSVGYAGTAGSNLLRTENQPSFGTAYSILLLATNGASSTYHSLQVQFRRRYSHLQTQLSYTWAHSIDSASNDVGGGFASILGSGQRGDSDFDVRQTLNWSGTWRVPGPESGILHAVFGNWYADWLYQAHTSQPFTVQSITTDTSANSTATEQSGGLFAQVRPDYTGAKLWIKDPNAPGGVKLNPAAFAAPSNAYAQGNLDRNSLRGFDFSQLDLSFRRQISISEKLKLNLALQAYNVLNHPNFANPLAFGTSNLSSPTFGLATRTVGGGVGGGSLYTAGGPRSAELSLRVQF
jgi:hypothetical protein